MEIYRSMGQNLIRFDSIHLIESGHFHDNWNNVSVYLSSQQSTYGKLKRESEQKKNQQDNNLI